MEDLDTILQGDLRDKEAFARAVAAVEAAKRESSASLEKMVAAWAPEATSLDEACARQEELAARYGRAERLLMALDAICEATAEAEKHEALLKDPLTRIAALASVPVLQSSKKDEISNKVPEFVLSVAAILDEVWADEKLGSPKERLQLLRQCVATFQDVMYASSESDSKSCPQILFMESTALYCIARRVSRMSVKPPASSDSTIQAELGMMVAELEKEAVVAEEKELRLRVEEYKSLLAMNGNGLKGTIHGDRLAEVNTTFFRLVPSLQSTVENWISASPYSGRRMGMALCAEIAEDIVRHILALDVIREKESHHLHGAISKIVAVYKNCFGSDPILGKTGANSGLSGGDDDDEKTFVALQISWERMCSLNDALEMTMAQIDEHWKASYARVLSKEEMSCFLRAAFSDGPRRVQILKTVAETKIVPVTRPPLL